MSEVENNNHPFAGAPVISHYSREQAIEDGVLIDVTQTATEAGFKYPVAITQRVFSEIVRPPELAIAAGESEAGRLWDVLWMLLCAIRAKPKANDPDGADLVYFEVIATDQEGAKPTYRLWSRCGPGDDGRPVITIMRTDED